MISSMILKQGMRFRRGACLSLGFLLAAMLGRVTAAPTNFRPIDDFVNQQGIFCLDDGTGGCFLFVPPVANFAGFSDLDTSLSVSVHYAGLADRWIQAESGGTQSIGTEFSGAIVERP